ncbi:MAG: tetratricopeptide repeat protein, partial [Planctomycetes bacterium]|nr:tetratricopeptide repeat protein [Planctomycetota bacterium]
LYELLAGRPPFDPTGLPLTMYARQVRETDPPLPSLQQGGFALSGVERDLDWITRHAIAPDKEERYDSVAELRADLLRFIDDQPVSVGPPSTVYYLRKFIRRNRALVGGLAAVFVVLVAGIATTTWWWFRAEESRVRAEQQEQTARDAASAAQRQARKAETINQFYGELLKFADPAEGRYRSRPDWTLREALDEAGPVVFRRLADDPDVEADVRLLIGSAYKSCGQLDKAVDNLSRAVELRRKTLGADHPDLADAMVTLAVALNLQGKHADSLQIEREAAQVFQRAHGEVHPKVALCHLNLGSSLRQLGKLDEARREIETALDVYARCPGDQVRFRAIGLSHLASVLRDQGQHDAAIQRYRDSLAEFEKCGRGWHPYAGHSHTCLAQLLVEHKRDRKTAAQHFARALEIHTKAQGPNVTIVGELHRELGMLAFRAGDRERAERHLQSAFDNFRRSIPKGTWTTVEASQALAALLRMRGDLDRAIEVARHGYRQAQGIGGPPNVTAGLIAGELIRSLRDAGKLAEAERLARERVPIAQANRRDPVAALVAENDLAIILTRRGKLAEARSVFDRILPASAKLVPESHWVRAMFRRAYGVYLGKARDFPAAERELNAALAWFERAYGKRHGNVTLTLRNLADLYRDWGRPADEQRCRARLAGNQ